VPREARKVYESVDIMAHTTVRISHDLHAVLKDIAAAEHATLQQILEAAIEEYRRRRFLEQINSGYADLRANDAEWARVCEERAAWDATIGDGLDPVKKPSSRGKRKR